MLGDGVIEDDSNDIQVDFANEVIGGGVICGGCVQEEIRSVGGQRTGDAEGVFSGCGPPRKVFIFSLSVFTSLAFPSAPC